MTTSSRLSTTRATAIHAAVSTARELPSGRPDEPLVGPPVKPIVYYVEGEILYRADRLDASGDLIGSPLAYGVKSWEANMVFLDLDEAAEGNPYDSDVTNDFDDILGTRIIATLGTNRPDIRVAEGGIFTRTYEWKLFPRNLMYERNR